MDDGSRLAALEVLAQQQQARIDALERLASQQQQQIEQLLRSTPRQQPSSPAAPVSTPSRGAASCVRISGSGVAPLGGLQATPAPALLDAGAEHGALTESLQLLTSQWEQKLRASEAECDSAGTPRSADHRPSPRASRRGPPPA